MAKYYELTQDDIVFTVLTDSAEMYGSRMRELIERDGGYTPRKAAVDFALHIGGIKTDNMLELNYYDKKRIHNLKYYTWVEQQGRTVEELNAQWYDDNYWSGMHAQVDEVDTLIEAFNEQVGLV
jgi:hypothetical protein